jgi:hypothetical protein
MWSASAAGETIESKCTISTVLNRLHTTGARALLGSVLAEVEVEVGGKDEVSFRGQVTVECILCICNVEAA